MGSYSDESAAWAAALSGDSDAFAATFELHRERVYRHALRVTENVHDAEDVTAAAFLVLWRRRKSVCLVNGSVLPWLLVTTTNLARNLRRGLRRYRALLDALPRSTDQRDAGDIAVERLEEARAAAQVTRALRAMRPSEAALLTLVVFENYSPTEAAAVLGISDGAARTRLHRARVRLTSLLGASPSGNLKALAKEEFR